MIFSVIVFVSFKTGLSLHDGRPTILRAILEDSTVYFLVIFSSHLVSLVVLLVTRVSLTVLVVIRTVDKQLGQPSLQLLPAL